MNRDANNQSQSNSRNYGNDLAWLLCSLPPVPNKIRYYDEYTETIKTIDDAEYNIWRLRQSGTSINFDFTRLPEGFSRLAKGWISYTLTRGMSAGTARVHFSNINTNIDTYARVLQELSICFESMRDMWITLLPSYCRTPTTTSCLKSLLRYLAKMNAGGLTEFDRIKIDDLPNFGRLDKYATIRLGEVFLDFREEAKIVAYLDAASNSVSVGNSDISNADLRAANLLYWMYAHAIRPIQLASRNISDAKVRVNGDASSTFHLRFAYAKQSKYLTKKEQIRRVRGRWVPLASTWLKRRIEDPGLSFDAERPNSLFGISPSYITVEIQRITETILGYPRNPYDFRHSAAQRKADEGASRVELAEFLMHVDLETADVYFDGTPTQADRVNKAYGLSPIFQDVADSIEAGRITRREMEDLPSDQQIGGSPHGRVIVGIGGCRGSVSLCGKVPGFACYGCQNFMALDEPEIH